MAKDPLASVDAFQLLVDPIAAVIRYDLNVDSDAIYDSVIDALLAYLSNPAIYRPERGRLGTFLIDIAKKRTIDRFRRSSASRSAEARFGELVELHGPDPKDIVESKLEAERLWKLVLDTIVDPKDIQALRLMIDGERSTEVLATAWGLPPMPADSRRKAVKRHRDRLMKVLVRLGKKINEES